VITLLFAAQWPLFALLKIDRAFVQTHKWRAHVMEVSRMEASGDTPVVIADVVVPGGFHLIVVAVLVQSHTRL